jgi:hypothetical protein
MHLQTCIESALRGNQNKPEITVKDLANDSRESDERSRKVQFLIYQGGRSEQSVFEMLVDRSERYSSVGTSVALVDGDYCISGRSDS